MIDLIVAGGAVTVFLVPLLAGFCSHGRPQRWHRAIIGIAGLQLLTLAYFGWLFGTSTRHVNHAKWLAPLLVVDVLMWLSFGIGFGLAALRYRSRTKGRS